MKKIEFVCKGCGKRIAVQEDIYDRVYKESGLCLSCRAGEMNHIACKDDLKRG